MRSINVQPSLLNVTDGKIEKQIPMEIDRNRAWLNLIGMNLTCVNLHEILAFVFDTWGAINRVSFRITEQDPNAQWPFLVAQYRHAWFLPLGPQKGTAIAKSKTNTRHQLKRCRKKLEEVAGLLEVSTYTGNQINDALLEKYLELKRMKYEIPDKEASAQKLRSREQFRITNVYTLETSNKSVLAMILTSEGENTAELINMAYDPNYKQMSPGSILYKEVVCSLEESGKEVLYLGTGNEGYKRLFGSYETDYWVGDAFRDFDGMRQVTG